MTKRKKILIKKIPQRAVEMLDFIDRFQRTRRYAPSFQEIMGTETVSDVIPIKSKITSSSVCSYYIHNVLCKRYKYLEMIKGQSRTVRLTIEGIKYLDQARLIMAGSRVKELEEREREINHILKESGFEWAVSEKSKHGK